MNISRVLVPLLHATVLVVIGLRLGGCASGPTAWEQSYVPEPAATRLPASPKEAPVNIRSVPMERVDAVMAELDREAAASDVPREQWSPETRAASNARLLRALQYTGDPASAEVLGLSRFRSTTLLRPQTSDSASLMNFARSIGADQAIWSTKYLGKAQTIVEKPVTTFNAPSYWGYGRRWNDDACWSHRDYWNGGSTTTWVPIKVEADEYLYVVFFLKTE